MDSSELAVIPAERGDLIEQAQRFAANAADLVVVDQRSYMGAANALVEVATVTKRLEDARKEEVRPLIDAKAAIDNAYKAGLNALGQARVHLETTTREWKREQERIRLEAQRAELAKAERERQRLAALAEKAEARGDDFKAEVFRAREDAVEAPIIPAAAPKPAGVSTRKVWRFRVVDEDSLPREYLKPDLEAIGGYVRALGEKAVGRIPGVEVFADEATIVRSAR